MKNTLLTINHQPFSQKELTAVSDFKIRNEKTPPWEKAVYEFIGQWVEESGTIVQYSSGTTGRSKKIHLSKQSMIRSAENTCRYFNLVRGQTAVLCLSAAYIAGKMMVVRSIVGRLNLQLVEPAGRPDLNGLDDIGFCAMVPMQVMNTFSAGGIFPPIRTLIVGGAEISVELENRVRDVPVQVYATYGMAETCSHIAVRRLNGPLPELYYQALPDIELETDGRNCLVIKAKYLPDPVVTNDQVQLAGNDRFRWIGRYDNLINSGGIKIVPEEVEAILNERTGFSCALIGLPDQKLGHKLIFVAEKNKLKAGDSRIKTELQKILPVELQPKVIFWVEKFPRNNAFKLDRQKLTKMVYHML